MNKKGENQGVRTKSKEPGTKTEKPGTKARRPRDRKSVPESAIDENNSELEPTPTADRPKERTRSQEPRVKKLEGEEHFASDTSHSALEIPTTDHSQLTTNMEVHHHPQLDHKPKPFKEYLLEGFMIFIAVMMGFIAENIRENITNNEHARQLISQLVQDLKTDTARLNKIYTEETQIVKCNDTLFDLLQQPLENADAKRILKLVYNSHSMSPFHPSAGAIAAIKNELQLKQFSNSRIISYIARYEGHIELLHTVQDITLLYQRSYLDPFLRLHFTPTNIDAAFSKLPVQNAQMRNLTQEDITQLGADMVLVRINSRELVRDNRLLKDDAVELLRYVTRQYHLE